MLNILLWIMATYLVSAVLVAITMLMVNLVTSLVNKITRRVINVEEVKSENMGGSISIATSSVFMGIAGVVLVFIMSVINQRGSLSSLVDNMAMTYVTVSTCSILILVVAQSKNIFIALPLAGALFLGAEYVFGYYGVWHTGTREVMPSVIFTVAIVIALKKYLSK